MIKIYTMQMCSDCVNLKEFCAEKNIKYEEMDIENNFKAKAKMIAKGLEVVPVLEINNEIYIGDIEYLKGEIIKFND